MMSRDGSSESGESRRARRGLSIARVSTTRRTQAGSAARMALLAVVLVAAGAGVVWFIATQSSGVRSGAQPDAASSTAPQGTTPAIQRPPPEDSFTPALEVGRSSTQPRPVPAPFDYSRFEGRGQIRGYINPPPGSTPPQVWRLVIEPSTTLIGGERAERRELSFEHGEQEFAALDLPLGGYDVRVSAFGLSANVQHVLLAKPAEDNLYLTFQLSPSGFIEGRVSSGGVGLEGVPLALEPEPPIAGVPARRVKSGPGGAFLFDDLSDGRYRLIVGEPASPVIPPREIDFKRPALHVDELLLPELGELAINVRDASGRALPDVELRGYGEHGGHVEARTDSRGQAVARFLPEGRYTVIATDSAGRHVKGRKLLAAGEHGSLELVLAP